MAPSPLQLTFKSGGTLLHQTAMAWLDNYCPSMGAALAYYTLFSLAPLMLIGVFLGATSGPVPDHSDASTAMGQHLIP